MLHWFRFFGIFDAMKEADEKLLLSVAARVFGRRGGLVRNPRKGFGSNGNARKAALARWAKVRKVASK